MKALIQRKFLFGVGVLDPSALLEAEKKFTEQKKKRTGNG